MRQVKIGSSISYTHSSVRPFIKIAEKKYKYVIDESLCTKEELVENNLLFVVSIAKRYEGNNIPLEDLLQCGCMGLMEAAEKFDPTKGFRFICFAIFYIRKNILNEIESHNSIITIPQKTGGKAFKLHKLVNKYIANNGYIPTADEIKKAFPEFESYVEYHEYRKNFTSADSTNSITDRPFYDVFASESKTESKLLNDDKKYILNLVLKCLSPREKDILTQCIMYDVSMSVMAEKYKISVERVRQIIKESLKSVRKVNKISKNNERFLYE